ncbi:hypothetical protein DV451_004477 [Geotrichum candidum]|uniref:SH3 domain-containing protein n=1 Tax=Geotrichum candidum TaxID=1173061 RepID=A0A9P5G0A8_GEOCN|nr:hypothetical protein DV451_004477 [Geotrichum candidum]
MSQSIDLSKHGKELKKAYDAIVSNDPSISWAVFNYEVQSNTLSPYSQGVSSSGANDDDWGDDAPPVVESEVTKVPSSYRPTKVDIAAIKSSAPKSSQFAATPAEPVKGSYQPVGKVDIAAIRAQAKDDRFNPKPSALQSSYKPVGKVDIAALKAQAGKKPSSYTSEPKPSAPALSQNDDDEDSVPKSFQDRMKAFGGNAAASGLDDEDETPKSLKDRLNKYEHNAERITSLPKPKVHNKVAGRFGAASSSSGTVPPLPVNSFSDSKKTVVGASRDFGSQGGKTPAQIWAEKHAKKTGTTPTASSSSKPESVDATETPSVSSLRSSFGSTAISQPSDEEPSSFNKQEEEEEEEESAPHVSDLKSRFAQKFASSTPSRSSEPVPVREASPEPEEESAPSLPTRSLPPPLPTAERSLPPPLPSAERPVPVPEPAQTTSQFPPPPTRSLPPAFVPPTSAPQEQEQEEEEEEEEEEKAPAAEAAPPTLPSRSEPESSTTEGASDGAPIEAVALFDYAKDDDNELALTENEKITVLEFSHEEWWLGRDSKGNEGLFPAEYVQVLKKPYAITLYEYEATEDNELTFPEGVYITDISFDDEDWWSGVYMNKRDLFPKNYVELQE